MLVVVPQVVLAVEVTLLWAGPGGDGSVPLAPPGSAWVAVVSGSLALWALAGLVVAALAHAVGSLWARRTGVGAGA